MNSGNTLNEQCRSTVAAQPKKYKQKTKEKKNVVATIATVPLEQIKSTVVFTHSPNKCHKTFIFSCGWSQFHILLFYFDL